MTKKGSSTRSLVDDINSRFNLEIELVEFGSPFVIIKSIELGSGISIMSRFDVEKEANKERIQIKPIKEIEHKRSFYSSYRKDKYISSVMKEFISFFPNTYGISLGTLH